ncbi:MAG: DUF2971 domain-containing protein [Lachnospiraceae bacterium]|nr:DUF2971 domain-containing protein [Lachnospiraceae bacterium]
MVSNQEKTEFLHSLIEKMQRQEDEAIIKADIQRILLSDTDGGKLYKYRAFNDFSLQNLENQTLHGSRPSVFNDPFDSRLGVDVQSLVDAKINLKFDFIVEAFAEFMEIYIGRKELGDCTDKNKPIIINLMNSKQLRHFLNETSELSEEDLNKYLYAHPGVLIDIISSIASNDEARKKMELTNKMRPQLEKYEPPKGQFKFPEKTVSFESFIRSEGIEDDADEISLVKSYYMKQKPDDCDKASKIERIFSDIDTRINQAVDNAIYIISLCADNKNRLMWSHYADNHKGFCIEYDCNLDNICDNVALISPVVYSVMRPKIPWKSFIAADNLVKKEIDKDTFTSFLFSFLTKDEVWSYEREWRILVPSTNKVMDIKAPPISCIYLGALCSEENQERMLSIAKQLDVPVKKMVIDRGEYNLHVESID